MTKCKSSQWQLPNIDFNPIVLEELTYRRQLKNNQPEQGGYFWGRYWNSTNTIKIESHSIALNPVIQTRYEFQACVKDCQSQGDFMHATSDLMMVGDWHTHPEPIATPSYRDFQATSYFFNDMRFHPNPYFFTLVLGQKKNNMSCFVVNKFGQVCFSPNKLSTPNTLSTK